ncbi:MAG TPA: hypothetical protein VK014_06665 [Cyclobacteriaceae bacterium]|nr:hypothetical protein [Cyclobacteriaceae bacterium]
MKPTFLFSIALLILMGCEIDNYEAPDLTITGQIVDAETKELVESGGINSGTILKFYEGNSQQPLLYQTYPEGTFTNSKVFAGVYTIEAEGPFTAPQGRMENIAINGNQEITVEVIPNVRLSITLEETSNSTAKAHLTFEKVVPNQELLDLGVVWAEYKNPNVYSFSGGSIIQEDMRALSLSEGEREFILENLKPNTTYYVRGTARTVNPGNYYNYSTQYVFKTP